MKSKFLTALALSATLAGTGCATWAVGENGDLPEAPRRVEAPNLMDASDAASEAVLRTALDEPGTRILVSKKRRHLWLMEDDRVVFDAPVAIGRDTIFRYNGQTWDFSTPAGGGTLVRLKVPLQVPLDHRVEAAHT